MKKLISVLMVSVMLLSLMIMPASAESLSEMFPQFKYIAKYEAHYGKWITDYDELYIHNTVADDENSADWVLMRCVKDMAEDPSGGGRSAITYAVVGEVVFNVPYYYSPFETGYAIYDVEKDVFTDLFDVNLDDYEGLSECLVLLSSKIGRLIGDVDKDGTLSIMDATNIQLCLAGLAEYSSWDTYGGKYSWIGGKSIKYLSDFDRDGERNILDVTAIQLKLAGIE